MKTNDKRIWMTVYLSGLITIVTLRAWSDPMATAAKPESPEKNYTGTVVTVDPKEHTLGLKGVMLSKSFNLGDNCTYTMVDKDAGTIGDLRPGQRVTASYQNAHGVRVADRVTQQPMRFEGAVSVVDPAQHTLILHVRGLDRTFQIANDCKIVLRNDQPGGLGDIQAGNYVTVTYEAPDATPTARQIAQTSERFTGSLKAIDLETKTIKARALFDTKKFNLGDHCVIVLNGKPNAQLGDLKPNDKLVFTYDEINGVNVVNRIAPAEAPSKTVVVTEPASGY